MPLISAVCFLLGGTRYAVYQIRDKIKEFTNKILPLNERFLLASFSKELLSLLIVEGQRFFFKRLLKNTS